MGEWIKHIPVEPKHKHDYPGLYQKFTGTAMWDVGSIWACRCGQQFIYKDYDYMDYPIWEAIEKESD